MASAMVLATGVTTPAMALPAAPAADVTVGSVVTRLAAAVSRAIVG
jgi:hypothetical protein